MKNKIIIWFVVVIVLMVGAFYYFSKDNYSGIGEDVGAEYDSKIAQNDIQNSPTNKDIHDNNKPNQNYEIYSLTNLDLPFDVDDINGGNKFFTPFGLIRHERDKGHGHAGIDIPLSKGDDIYAVSDGTIIINKPATDGGDGNSFEGNNVVLLIAGGYNEGEGWGFLYEHINLDSEINLGSIVDKGQLIGTSALTNGNNHLGLAYYFDDFKYTRDSKCWVDNLNGEDKQRLLAEWEEISMSPEFINSWTDSFEDGAYPYRALLDKNNFPNGPQLCYDYGLDVRIR